jgi:hypothetical protein
MLAWTAVASAQAYPLPYAGYGYPGVPAHAMMPQPPAAMYAWPAPFYPGGWYPMPTAPLPFPNHAPPNSAPKLRGWPPPPGSVPPPANFDIQLLSIPQERQAKNPPASVSPACPPIRPIAKDKTHKVRRLPLGSSTKAGPPETAPATVQPTPQPGSAETYELQVQPHAGTPLMCEAPVCTPVLPPHEITHPEDPRRAPRGHHCYGEVDYLFWWLNSQNTPTLLAATDLAGNTTTLVGGGEDFDSQQRHGAMFTVGAWVNARRTVALEASYFFLGERAPRFAAASDGTVTLSRPFFNTFTQTQDLLLIAFPGSPGSMNIDTLSRLWGTEANVRWECLRTCWGHLDWLTGLRYLDLEEHLNITTTSTDPVAGTVVGSERFATQNQFFAAQIGLQGEANFGWFFVDSWAKLAAGMNRQLVDIQGENGFLANAGNIGRRRFDRFTALPSAGITVGARLGEHVRLAAGYSVLFLNNAVRPNDAINTNIALAPGVGPLSFFERRESQFWAQGVHLGLEFRY